MAPGGRGGGGGGDEAATAAAPAAAHHDADGAHHGADDAEHDDDGDHPELAVGDDHRDGSAAAGLTPEEVAAAIVKQVEFYLSDANLPTDKHLLKHVRKDADGFVPIKLIAGFKRIRALTRDAGAVAAALRSSGELVVDAEGRRVRRRVPLAEVDTAAIARRIVVAEHLGDGPTIGGPAR